MESTGYLTRRRNPEDERSLIVSLTDKGQALQAEAQEISTCVIEAMGGDLNELIELRDRVNALRARLDSA